MSAPFSTFAARLKTEGAFDVLAVARALKARGKDVVELEIGDSPFPTTRHALRGGIAALEANETHYGPSIGLMEFRAAVAEARSPDLGVPLAPANIVAGCGAKIFEQFFCEAFLNPGDAVLVFSPQFPTYVPNLERRQAEIVFSVLRPERQFRPSIEDVERFLRERPRARAIFLNSPHNPTGGVAEPEDIRALADLVRGRPIALFSDEPYNHMVWRGRHVSPLSEPGMLEQCVAAYTFSKSYSMSGWRLGYAITSPRIADMFGKLANTSISCVPPFVQRAGLAALRQDAAERDANMRSFGRKVERLAALLAKIDGIRVVPPAGTFYVFPSVAAICNRFGITSHGLALYLLEAADDQFGVACLGGECFGDAGAGFLRLSCAEPDERLVQAIDFLPDAFGRAERIHQFVRERPQYRLEEVYPEK